MVDFHVKLGAKYPFRANRMVQKLSSIFNKAIEMNWNHLNPAILVKLSLKKDCKNAMEQFCHKLENLSNLDWIDSITNNKDVNILKTAIDFFKDKNTLLSLLKSSFSKDKIHIATDNNKQDYLLNNIENNHIRMIYDVDRLTEGWDVLNLFDIVRLYETRDSKTIKEAQLIGRGARYCPFVVDDFDDKYRRKFDNDLNNELCSLEQMHYHCQNESKFIYELNQALIKEGIKDETRYEITMKVKEEFKTTDIYKIHKLYRNKAVKKERTLFSDDKIRQEYDLITEINLSSDRFVIKSESLLSGVDKNNDVLLKEGKNYIIKDINKNMISHIMDADNFFHFDNLKEKLPNIKTRNDFIDLIGNIQVSATKIDANIVGLILGEIKNRINNNFIEYEGTNFDIAESISKIIEDKTLYSSSEKDIINGESYKFLAQTNIKHTDQEKEFLQFINIKYENISVKTDYFWVIRNETMLPIFNFKDGQKMYPDFIILSKIKDNDEKRIQIFIEPKGEHLLTKQSEINKEKFLKDIKTLKDITLVKGISFFISWRNIIRNY